MTTKEELYFQNESIYKFMCSIVRVNSELNQYIYTKVIVCI